MTSGHNEGFIYDQWSTFNDQKDNFRTKVLVYNDQSSVILCVLTCMKNRVKFYNVFVKCVFYAELQIRI